MSETYYKTKPLLKKMYGSIPHLPNSRLGDGDHFITYGQADIMTHKVRDKHDVIIVQEKLDGSCVGVANIDGVLVPVGRRGHPTKTAPYDFLPMFDIWVERNIEKFSFLLPGERIVGEWLCFAHGTVYDLQDRDPFVCFDLFGVDGERVLYNTFLLRTTGFLTSAPLLHHGDALPTEEALNLLGEFGHYNAKEKPEGLVYRCERKGRVDYLAKYVHHDKVDGKYFPPHEPIWMWRP